MGTKRCEIGEVRPETCETVETVETGARVSDLSKLSDLGERPMERQSEQNALGRPERSFLILVWRQAHSGLADKNP